MTSRRQLLQAGLAAAAWPLATAAAAGRIELAAAVGAAPLYKVLYDTRFAAAAAFAERAVARGLAVEGIAGDVTRFWYEDLDHRWRRGGAAVAGLTAYGALFCLERLAWDHGLRVVYRGEHSRAPEGGLAHRLEGTAAMLDAAAAATSAGTWAESLADVVAEGSRSPGRSRMSTLVSRCAGPIPAEPLYSWVIAPVARARGYR